MQTVFCPALRAALLRLAVLMACWLGVGALAWARGQAGEVTLAVGAVNAVGIATESAAAARALKVGDKVFQGERIITGPGGHLHIKTVDGGLLALRPDSRARIEIYEYDVAHPAGTRIRLVLENGVLRAASGAGAQAARDKFRLNTPVAAIGIRGTDFTVSANEGYTRVVVQQGAVVVAAFGADCSRELLGPCAGAFARSLSADQAGKLLELRRGDREPQLLDLRPGMVPVSTASPGPTKAAAAVAPTATTAPTAPTAPASSTSPSTASAPTSSTAPTPAAPPATPIPAPAAVALPASPSATALPATTPAPAPITTTATPSYAAGGSGSNAEVIAVVAIPLPVERLPGATQAPLTGQISSLASEARGGNQATTAVAAAAQSPAAPVDPAPPAQPVGASAAAGTPSPSGGSSATSSTSAAGAAPTAPAPAAPSSTPTTATAPATAAAPATATAPATPTTPFVSTTPPTPTAPVPTPIIQPTPLPVAVWGRWAVFAGTAPAADTNAFRAANGPFVATNKAYVLSVLDAQNIRMPETGSFEFKLANSEAWETQNGTLISRASVSGGRLSVNFGARSFSTALNVDVAGETVALSADGRITSAGALEGFLIYSKPGINMNVRGSLAGNTANQAAYIFDAPLSGSNRGVVGAASWGR